MRILICDDEVRYIQPLRKCLEQYMTEHNIPSEITEAVSPQKILLSKVVYDIAFLDIQMENVDGLTLAKELRRRNRKTALFSLRIMKDIRTMPWIFRPSVTLRSLLSRIG